MKFVFYNDTGRTVSIHPATYSSGVRTFREGNEILPLEEVCFVLPANMEPWVKMWDYGTRGLSILVMAQNKE